MTETDAIMEFVAASPGREKIDRKNGVLRDVKILGLESRNHRVYPETTLRAAIPLYENAKVNLNHPDGDPGESRKYQDRFGVMKNVRIRPKEGLYADFHFNPKHPLAEQLLWDAENSPENVGFSHNVQAVLTARDDQQVVEEIVAVRSVDLVADPATTAGLFEDVRTENVLLKTPEAGETPDNSETGKMVETEENEADIPKPRSSSAPSPSDLRKLGGSLAGATGKLTGNRDQEEAKEVTENEGEGVGVTGQANEVESLRSRVQFLQQILEAVLIPAVDHGGEFFDSTRTACWTPRFLQLILEAAGDESANLALVEKLLDERREWLDRVAAVGSAFPNVGPILAAGPTDASETDRNVEITTEEFLGKFENRFHFYHPNKKGEKE